MTRSYKFVVSLSHWLCLFLLPLAAHAQTTCLNKHTNVIQPTALVIVPNSPSTLPVWNAAQAYTTDNRVQSNNMEYQARWWTQGNAPGGTSGDVWQLLIGSNGLPQPWQIGQVYYAAEQTVYLGNLYTAKQWTKGIAPNLAGSGWTFVRMLDTFSHMQLTGAYDTSQCSGADPETYTISLTLNWAIAQDPDKTFAYWKQLDVRTGQEIVRGVGRQGTMIANYGFQHIIAPPGQPPYPGPAKMTGQNKALYLCSAHDECRNVVPVFSPTVLPGPN